MTDVEKVFVENGLFGFNDIPQNLFARCFYDVILNSVVKFLSYPWNYPKEEKIRLENVSWLKLY